LKNGQQAAEAYSICKNESRAIPSKDGGDETAFIQGLRVVEASNADVAGFE
jgi:hypothetical protein